MINHDYFKNYGIFLSSRFASCSLLSAPSDNSCGKGWSSQVDPAVLRGAVRLRTLSGMKGAVVRFPAVHVVQLLYVQIGQGALEVAHSLLRTECIFQLIKSVL